MYKLNVLISTINEGIYKLKNVILNKREDIEYIISHQYTEDKYKIVPKELIRDDIFISHIKGFGVTKSRNNAIKLANGFLGVFADDDVKYCHKYFDTILEVFSSNKNLDLALFKIKTLNDNIEYKLYPDTAFKLSKIPFSIGTIEIAFNIDIIKKNKIRFDERFGAGQPILIGAEENIFILDCIKAGLNVWYYPKYIVEHPFDSTAKKLSKYDVRKVKVTGAFDARVNGWVSIPKAFLGTIKLLPDLIRNKKNPVSYLKERMFAALFILCNFNNRWLQ